MGQLDGKVAIIAGAGQTAGEGIGNGRATALAFAREGARLVLASRSSGPLEDTRDAVRAEGFEAEIITADITSMDDCHAMAAAAMKAFGRIDVLHNNAAIGAFEGDSVNIQPEEWRQVMDINLNGAAFASKAVLPAMREQKSGCITHVGSIAAVAMYPIIAYKASKAALNEFTRWLAFENAKYGIRANVLQLGLIDTPLAIEGYHEATGTPREELRAQRAAQVPMGRMGTAWELAAAAVFLASDAASYISGAVLPLDGALATKIG
ncbi:MAG: SDR family NAD(P)-dependent oxidoreductase [Minwuia sp.]|uniref:SDR family NAD(P)-dependent oxidoreductase n=1 Tax=Minwuia sp. TaxID=2493630 RepID=UPI003A8B020F